MCMVIVRTSRYNLNSEETGLGPVYRQVPKNFAAQPQQRDESQHIPDRSTERG